MTCFLIDDDTDDHEIFELALEKVDPSIKCTYFNDPVNALERMRADKEFVPKIFFIDINMPLMNGMECLAEIRKMDHVRHIPVCMYFTSANPAIINECKRLGATDFIVKSSGIDELEKALSEILSQYNTA
jgi:DNA-binding NtrC family response regulator